jgi:hypothetical protein
VQCSSMCYQRTDSVAVAETLPDVEHTLRVATCWDHPFDSQVFLVVADTLFLSCVCDITCPHSPPFPSLPPALRISSNAAPGNR